METLFFIMVWHEKGEHSGVCGQLGPPLQHLPYQVRNSQSRQLIEM